MTFSQEFAQFLSGKKAIGCSKDEVSQLENKFKVSFDSNYREFLRKAGKGVSDLWSGSDYKLEMLALMQEAAFELLSAEELDMPNGSFVFYMHQGYQFYLFNDEGVFYFHEGDKRLEKGFSNFGEFFLDSLTW